MRSSKKAIQVHGDNSLKKMGTTTSKGWLLTIHDGFSFLLAGQWSGSVDVTPGWLILLPPDSSHHLIQGIHSPQVFTRSYYATSRSLVHSILIPRPT